MAGFGIFRNYQKASLVALAILSMLAFFVLPPLLQWGGQSARIADAQVARWNGGEIRERALDRAMTMTAVVNRFLAEATVAAGRDPRQAPSFPQDEQAIVRKLLLADEARKEGLVVSDGAINDFLARLTSGQVRADQFDQIMEGLRRVGGGVSQADLFEALRTELLAENMLLLVQRSLVGGDPPGLRWDYFKRMEQSATAEVVAVDVRSVGDQVTLPPAATLRAFFEKHKDELPDPTSEKPGFREPHRARVEYLVAKRGVFVDEISKEVTDEEIAEYYEKNKTSMFRARPAPAAPPAPAGAEVPPADETPPAEPPAGDTTPAATPASEPAVEPADAVQNEAAAGEATSESAPDATAAGVPEADPAPPAVDGGAKPDEGSGAALRRPSVRTVAYLAPQDPPADEPAPDARPTDPALPVAAEEKSASDAEMQKDSAAVDPVATPNDGEAKNAAPVAGGTEDAAAVPDGAAPAAEGEQFEPLEAVSGRIRDQIARERANAKVDIIFNRVVEDFAGYSQDYALWQAREEAKGIAPPKPPDVDGIATLHGLDGGRSPLWSPVDAREAGGIGASGTFVSDRSNGFGFREVPWAALIYGQGAQNMRPVQTQDRDGNRYVSWRVEDQPEFTPTFETARPAVESAWKIVEGRAAARKRAEEIASKAAGAESLEAAIAGDETLQSLTVGPFFWMNPQAALSGIVQVSQPTGIVLPGDEFMAKVFALRPGEVGVAFNEPKTVCYVIRLIDVEPPEEKLKERFTARRGDPQLVAVAAQEARMNAFQRWLEGLEARYDLEWKRQPRQ